MNEIAGRDLDLNLLRVFVTVASAGSVTQAASRLYVTQSAVSAAMGRLTDAVGAALFVRKGRGIALTRRGEKLFADVQPLLSALVDAALSPATFDPRISERAVRIGVSDVMEGWLLPPLLELLRERAPRLTVVAQPVNFRTVAEAFASGRVELALTVADDLPDSIRRMALAKVGYRCLFDPRKLRLPPRPTEATYFAQEHVIVSYNGDLRGVVEDMFRKQRRVRCVVSSFSHVGSIVSGSRLVATLPVVVARHLLTLHPKLASCAVPFKIPPGGFELLWPATLDEDPAARFVREQVREVVTALMR